MNLRNFISNLRFRRLRKTISEDFSFGHDSANQKVLFNPNIIITVIVLLYLSVVFKRNIVKSKVCMNCFNLGLVVKCTQYF